MQHAARDQVSCLVDFIEVAVGPAQRNRLPGGEGPREDLQVMRVPDVVLIQKRDQVARGMRHAQIPSRGLTAVRLAEQLDRVALAELLDNRHAVIGGTVIDHDHFVRRQGLADNAGEGLPQKPRSIIQRNDRGYRDGGMFCQRFHNILCA